MLRKLLIVFASGLVLAVVALSAAWLAGGRELRDQVVSGDVDWNFGDRDERHDGPRITRSFTLASGARLTMAIPVELEFRRGEKAGMTVEGPKDAVDHLLWEGGRLSLGSGVHHIRHGLKVVIVAPEIAALDFEAPADVELRGMDQEEFRLTANGAVSLDAQGRVRRLFVDSEGAANLDLSKVEGEDATVRLDGAGSIDVAATNLADVQINGVGNVSLKKKPKTVRTQINGLGSIDRDYEE
jgi:hypothetical protein